MTADGEQWGAPTPSILSSPRGLTATNLRHLIKASEMLPRPFESSWCRRLDGVAADELMVEFPFEILREVWSSYELEDGTVLRSRTILTKVLGPRLLPEKSKQVQLGFAFN